VVDSDLPGGTARFRDSLRSGLRSGLALATLFSLLVTVERLLLGPGAFARVGMPWEELVTLYFVTFSLGGLAYGALLPLRRPGGLDLAAMASGVLFVTPMYLGCAVLMSPLFPSVQVALGVGAFVAFFVGIPVGLTRWDNDKE